MHIWENIYQIQTYFTHQLVNQECGQWKARQIGNVWYHVSKPEDKGHMNCVNSGLSCIKENKHLDNKIRKNTPVLSKAYSP